MAAMIQARLSGRVWKSGGGSAGLPVTIIGILMRPQELPNDAAAPESKIRFGLMD